MCPVQNCEYALNTQAFTNCASPPFNPVKEGIGGMVILPTSLRLPISNIIIHSITQRIVQIMKSMEYIIYHHHHGNMLPHRVQVTLRDLQQCMLS